MRRLAIMAMAAVLLAAVWPAAAQPGPGQGQGQGQGRGMDRPMPERPMGPPPGRGWQRPDGDGMQHRRGMMSPEERDQLRRDIGRHGRDIYRDPRGGGPGKR